MLLDVAGAHTFYGPSHVLHGLSLHAGEGEVVAVLGRNGMGKTTLVHTIAGLLHPRTGSVRFAGRDITGRAPEQIADLGLALVPQGHRVFGSLTVAENLAVARRKPRDGRGWTVDEVCERFPILRQRWGVRAGSLSGGQQQVLTVARALVGNGRMVLMDEPAEGLDPTTVGLVGDVIEELRARGTAVLVVEQKVDFALALADRAVILSRGTIVHETSSPEALRRDPAAIARHLGFGADHVPASGRAAR